MKEYNRREILTRMGKWAAWPLMLGAAPLVVRCGSGPVSQTVDRKPLDDATIIGPNQAPRGRPETEPVPLAKSREGSVTVMAVGDIMTHQSNIKGAWSPKIGGYDFAPYFEYVAPLFKQADWVLGNLETRLAGGETGYTGYPLFNAPEELARDLRQAGFTYLSTANNHCLDRGLQGVTRTNRVLSEAGLVQSGTSSSPEEREKICFLEKNGIKTAILAYTYGTNGIPIPAGKKWAVNLIDPELMIDDINRAGTQGADFVICFLHFGDEYVRRPNARQEALVRTLFEHGADIVLGSHPHVVQPYQHMKSDQGDGLVIYSMGNFIANQMKKYTDLGVIFTFRLTKDSAGRTSINEVDAWPTRILRLRNEKTLTYRVVPLRQMLTDPAAAANLPANMVTTMEDQLLDLEQHLKSMPA
jgi:poly-gamma-glutamate capsule biosynthesis protein CapA/YwtB (metallophosphatase superfamily)